METIPASDPGAVLHAARVLDDRGLVVLPADTRYVLAADALDEEAVLEAFRAAGRGADRALPVCVGGLEDVAHVASLTPLARRLADRHWPGPVALVLRAKPWLPDAVTAGGETVAVRAPGHPFALALARHFGPYVAAGARVAGQPQPLDAAEARASMGARARLVVDGGRLSGAPSTVVDCTGDQARVLREGAVPAAEVAGDGRQGH